ncbi:DNA adenine methylase [Bradyrhizobium sp. USDA 4341]
MPKKGSPHPPSFTVRSKSAQEALTRPGAPTRPAVRWHGGKWLLAPFILDHLPPHRIYVEPFGGGGSVLLRKERSHSEVYNDLDGSIVNLFRVLRDQELGSRLVSAVELTPFARDEFVDAYEPTDDPVEKARRLLVVSFMGFGSNSNSGRTTGFRANGNRNGTVPSMDWRSLSDALPLIIDRLRGVTIENRDALEVIEQHDADETLFYIDPPYLFDTRASAPSYLRYKEDYGTESEHKRLLLLARRLRGAAVVSGYPSELYDEALPGWKRVSCRAYADGARDRTEVLWINPRAWKRLEHLHGAYKQTSIFDVLGKSNIAPAGDTDGTNAP